MSDRPSNPRAFTLLEVLLATAMMAVLAASLYASLAIAFKARRSAFAAVDPVRTCALALDLVSDDLRSALIPNGVLAGAFLGQPAFDASGRNADSLIFCCIAPDLDPDVATGDVKQVEFACDPSVDARGQVLVRRVTTNLLSPRSIEPREEVLCRGVATFALRYFTGTEWVDTWDSTVEDNLLPPAVEVTLQMESDPPGNPSGGYRLSRVLLVPCGTTASGVTQAAADGS